jgi:hypothetical protein
MTLASQTTKIVYEPDGQTYTYAVPFPVFDVGDIECAGSGIADG